MRITTEGGHGRWMQKLDEQRGKLVGKKAASTILTVKPAAKCSETANF